jgi:hypothetical protein
MNYTQKKYEEIKQQCIELHEQARVIYERVVNADFYDIEAIENSINDIRHIQDKVKPIYLDIQDYWISEAYEDIRFFIEKLEDLLTEQVGLSETLDQ